MKANLPIQLLTTLIWASAGASTVYWLIQFSTPPTAPTPINSTAVQPLMTVIPQTAVVQFLKGSTASPAVPAPPAASATLKRFELLGVVTGPRGAALIAVNGQPARPFAVGSPLDESTYLKAVGKRFVLLGNHTDEPGVQRIDMPDTPKAD